MHGDSEKTWLETKNNRFTNRTSNVTCGRSYMHGTPTIPTNESERSTRRNTNFPLNAPWEIHMWSEIFFGKNMYHSRYADRFNVSLALQWRLYWYLKFEAKLKMCYERAKCRFFEISIYRSSTINYVKEEQSTSDTCMHKGIKVLNFMIVQNFRDVQYRCT